VEAVLLLADVFVSSDVGRSDALAEEALSVAPETELAYERLLQNARQRGDQIAARRILKRYEHAAAQFAFAVNPYVADAAVDARPRRRAVR